MRGFLWIISFASVAHAGVELTPAQIRPAIEKSLSLLQNTGKEWFGQQSCTSCHHSVLPTLALMTARRHGVTINETLAREHFRQAYITMTDLDFLSQGSLLVIAPAFPYFLWAVQEAGLPQNNATAAFTRIMASQQRPDGHWRTLDNRPPQSGSLFTVTALGIRAIKSYLPREADAKVQERISRARHWLETQPPVTTEDETFRLLGAKWAGESAPLRQKYARQLIAQQRPDGGWSQLSSLPSDAYATGEILVALIEAGEVPVGDPAVRRGLEYLLKTQLPDGSWLVQSRIHNDAPVSPPYFESGFPHKKNQFTSASGTSWAAMALSLALPLARVEPFSLAELVPPQEPWIDVAMFGSTAEVRKLDPNSKTKLGTTALMLAASDLEKVKALLERGADVNARANSGFSALTVACAYGGNIEVVRLLLEKGAAIEPPAGVKVLFNQTPLMQAVLSGELEKVKLLVDRKSDVRRKSMTFDEQYPIQMAVLFNDEEIVEYLARKNSPVNEPDPNGTTPLAQAALSNYSGMVELLARFGADPNYVDRRGMTPLIWAASIEFGSAETVKALLKAGARPDLAGREGITALSQANRYGLDNVRAALQQANSK
jgi:ankyrin repeat protein